MRMANGSTSFLILCAACLFLYSHAIGTRVAPYRADEDAYRSGWSSREEISGGDNATRRAENMASGSLPMSIGTICGVTLGAMFGALILGIAIEAGITRMALLASGDEIYRSELAAHEGIQVPEPAHGQPDLTLQASRGSSGGRPVPRGYSYFFDKATGEWKVAGMVDSGAVSSTGMMLYSELRD